MLNSSTSYSDTPIKKTKLERKMIDRFRLWAKGGDGGNGYCSVRRSRAERQGTPDGGSGGRGGDVILECSPKVWDFRNLQHHASMCKTSCTSSTEFQTAPSFSKYQPSINKKELISHPEIGETENKDLENTENETEDNMEGKEEIQYNVAELTKQGQRIIKVSNDEDQPSLSTGLPGSESVLVLELKSIADVGLIGMPNAGKRNLNYDDFFSVTVAEIPGIVKGAHENRGLGHAFIRHIERTKVLAYVVDLATALDGKKGIPPWVQLRDLVLDLEFHQEGLSDRPSLVVANKIDEEGTEGVLEELKIRVPGVPVFPVCAVLGERVVELKVGLRYLLMVESIRSCSWIKLMFSKLSLVSYRELMTFIIS
ncbi:hypothetical protein MKX01_041354 [Papaver californicum]|nr:hypothetical protein MKX01_041354 [Papaver californicum]